MEEEQLDQEGENYDQEENQSNNYDQAIEGIIQGVVDNKETELNLMGTYCCCISFSLDIADAIGHEGAAKLSEALKTNTSLTCLNLDRNSCCFVSF
jgi:hypothetical protein